MWDVWLISRLNTVQGDQPYQTPASNPKKGVTYLSNIALPPATWASVQHCRDPSRVVMYACVFLFLCPLCIGNEEKYGHCHLSKRNLDGHRQLNLWDSCAPDKEDIPCIPPWYGSMYKIGMHHWDVFNPHQWEQMTLGTMWLYFKAVSSLAFPNTAFGALLALFSWSPRTLSHILVQ